MKEYHLSIKELIEFVLRQGDITSSGHGRLNNERAVLGTKIHRRIEKKLEQDGNLSEVFLKYEQQFPDFALTVDGRADSIHPDKERPIIVEIKSTDLELDAISTEQYPLHWAQAQSYAYLYCLKEGCQKAGIQLIYCNVETFATKTFFKEYTLTTLEEKFLSWVESYLEFLQLIHQWRSVRNESLQNLQFPFPQYREGQRELAVGVYRAIRSSTKLFVEAPTGIGKTMSTIFPALKAMGEDKYDKLFYLTAKTTTRILPKQAVDILTEQSGLRLITTILYAKEKICKCAKPMCNPETCPYAKGHYDRINNAVLDALGHDRLYDMERLQAYAEKHKVCPFEFALDLTLWSDFIICDYNYVFDPNVYLRRFFEDGNTQRYTLLIDEAHNLADRAREMYSVSLEKRDFMDFKQYTKQSFPLLSKALSRINKHFIAKGKDTLTEVFGKQYLFSQENDQELIDLVYDAVAASGDFLEMHPKDEMYDRYLQTYFNMVFYLKLSDWYDSSFCTYYTCHESDGTYQVLCLDPSSQLKKSFEKVSSSILFSATLIPMNYYYQLLGGEDTDSKLVLSSPFVPENKCVLCATDVCASYKKRDFSYEKIADYIAKTVMVKRGNYMVFFPSYRYMQTVYQIFSMKYPELETVVQSRGASDLERESFIASFEADETKNQIGFCVLGGVYSEGIDLKGDRLIGAILVGVGIPQVSVDRELIKEYFDAKARENYEALQGFDFAYVYPGFTKILQSAGRVIRSEEDRGVILLLDERYHTQKYMELFPSEWQHVEFIELKDTEERLKEFWND